MEWEDEQADAFSQLLKQAREAAHLTQLALAEKTGLTQATVSQLEKGPYIGMRFIDLARLCAFFGIPLAQVAGMLDVGPGYDTPPQAGLDALLTGLSAPDKEFVRRVIQTLTKGLR